MPGTSGGLCRSGAGTRFRAGPPRARVLGDDARLPIGLANVDRPVEEPAEFANGDGRRVARGQRRGDRLRTPGLKTVVDGSVDTKKTGRVDAARKSFRVNGGAEEDRTPDL